MAVSVVIPAYNESDAVKDVVAGTAAALKDFNGHEIIVVDDGSTDGTGMLAAEAGARVITLERNSGYGAALKAGIRAAKNDTIAILDCDGSYSAADVPRLLAHMERGVMVVGVRKIIWRQMGRNVYKFLFNRLVGLMVGKKVRDINSGIRAFDRRDLMIYERLLCDRFSFSTSSAIIYLRSGMRIKYVGADYFPRVGRSHMRARDALTLMAVALKTLRGMKECR